MAPASRAGADLAMDDTGNCSPSRHRNYPPGDGTFFATSRVTHLSHEQFFGIAFWIGFSINALIVELWLRSQEGKPQIGRNKRLVVDELERVDLGKMNLQLIANEENQDRAQCGKNETGGMISFVCRARKHLGNGAADDRSDDAEHDRPEDRHTHVHHRSCDDSRD
jgi:hypothetical protein